MVILKISALTVEPTGALFSLSNLLSWRERPPLRSSAAMLSQVLSVPAPGGRTFGLNSDILGKQLVGYCTPHGHCVGSKHGFAVHCAYCRASLAGRVGPNAGPYRQRSTPTHSPRDCSERPELPSALSVWVVTRCDIPTAFNDLPVVAVADQVDATPNSHVA